MKKLTAMDSMFLFLETREVLLHVGALCIFKIPDNYPGNFFQELMGRFRSVTEFEAPFNYRLSHPISKGGLPHWVEDQNFDLDYHIRHSALPQPGSMKELNTLVSRIHGTMLDRNRPLWEFYLIEGMQGNRFAMYCKMHHAIIDGVAGMNLLKAMLSDSVQDYKFSPLWEAKAQKKKKKTSKKSTMNLAEKVSSTVSQQAKTLSEIGNAFFTLGKKRFMEKKDHVTLPFEAPQSLLNQDITGQRVFVTTSIPLDQMKTVGKKFDAKINDMVTACCAGAIRKFLLDNRALPEGSLTALVPISIRKDSSNQGNQIGNLLYNLGTNIADPVARLEKIKKSATEGKEILQGMSGMATVSYSMLLGSPAILINLLGLANKVNPTFNVLISNIPGPQAPMYFNSAELESIYPVPFLFDGQALNMTVTSNRNSMDFGLIACRDTLPNVQKLADYLQDAFEELKTASKK